MLGETPPMLRTSLGLDLRSLALMRICVAALYLVDLLSMLPYVEAFYSDSGLLPRHLLAGLTRHSSSLYMCLAHPLPITLVYLLHIAVVAAVLVGYRTRWACLLAFVLATSLQARIPINPGWDGEIRLLMLYGCFLPWGAVASWDARQARGQAAKPLACNAATIGWRLQVLLIYLGAGLLKGGPYWQDGTAVDVSLHADGYCTVWAARLLSLLQPYPDSLVWLNDLVPLAEILLPLFLFFPSAGVQVLAAGALMAMHLAFGLCLDIDLFSWLCCAGLLCFIPSSWWNRLLPGLSGEATLPELSPWSSAALSWIGVWSVLSMLSSLPEGKGLVSEQARISISSLGLQQRWAMFVPPPTQGGWHVVRGRTRGQREVDLMYLRPLDNEDKPAAIHTWYPNVRWYLHFVNHLSQRPTSAAHRRASADYFRRRWEQRNPDAIDGLEEVEIVYWRRDYRPGRGYTTPQRLTIWKQAYGL